MTHWHLHPPEVLPDVAVEWNSLVCESKAPPFLTTDFVEEAVRHFSDSRCVVALGRQGGVLVNAAILQQNGPSQWTTFQPSQLPLGCWITRGPALGDEVQELMRTLPGIALKLDLTQQDPMLTPRPNPFCADTLDYVATGWVDVSDNYDDFWNSRGKNLRQNLRKQARRIEGERGRLDFSILTSPNDVQTGIVEFAAIEAAGWKSTGGTAVSTGSAQDRFYQSVLGRFAKRGAAFAIRLSVDDVPIAVDLGIRDQSTAILLKTTYDEDWSAFSPAQLLHERAFQHFFSINEIRRVEFYGKFMEWHSRWTSSSRMLYHASYYRTPLVRQAVRALRRFRSHAAP